MLAGALGRKVGMTQIFSEEKVIPVTAIEFDNWYVTEIKKNEKDGYDAVQLGSLRPKYQGKEFSNEWLKNKKKFFAILKEVSRTDLEQDVVPGQPIDFSPLLVVGEFLDVYGTTKGRGFQGVVKRHGFAGGPASHGPRMGRRPGSIGFIRAGGRVMKGQKMPGHMGTDSRVIRNLKIVKVDPDSKLVLVKGSVPGNSGSFVFMKKV
jgi:large subunit ribosomal protein L3